MWWYGGCTVVGHRRRVSLHFVSFLLGMFLLLLQHTFFILKLMLIVLYGCYINIAGW